MLTRKGQTRTRVTALILEWQKLQCYTGIMTTNILSSLAHLCDKALLAEAARLADRERQATAHLIAALAELDARRLYLGTGWPVPSAQ